MATPTPSSVAVAATLSWFFLYIFWTLCVVAPQHGISAAAAAPAVTSYKSKGQLGSAKCLSLGPRDAVLAVCLQVGG